MTALSPLTTLGDIVARHPQTARVLESLGLDYCCGGGKPLGQTCREKGLDAGAVLEQIRASLAEPSPEGDWVSATMTQLADHIEQTHHEYLRRELPRLTGLLRKVVGAHGDRRPELAALQEVFAGFAEELADHMMKEERMLFPWIRRLEAGAPAAQLPGWSVAGPVACMMHEHDGAGDALARMRGYTDGFTAPADACGTFRALYAALGELERDMHRHVHKENNILFPRAIAAEVAARARTAGCAGAATGQQEGCEHGCDHRIDT
ncbi:MAG TPA: iron-sulfur cluster repair di-iron protein [Phycisphaerales bacterium]|nr:iron-sulfur cluster repair di-iron protein [Phycisphaerales bacterium]